MTVVEYSSYFNISLLSSNIGTYFMGILLNGVQIPGPTSGFFLVPVTTASGQSKLIIILILI